ncbi:UDP-xylose and UDP-N-acetylglucosamine transporter-like isoform X2 [Mytilus galloprovincialis]|uniref:UDP-xylose and UDP-N-acetylglucosamine transporter-like isoform X2 n=1 Tax=Mytilus galloprovincialis TaxID=29158 RepID=UPI003F7B7638
MHPAIPISLVFLGCCSNVVFLEYLISDLPTCGNLITFMQFAFIAVEGLIFTAKFGMIKPKIPIRIYGTMVSLFFLVQVANNAAYSFNISMPLQMVFRAGSLIANLTLGMIIMKKRYTTGKYISVVLITVGIILCTIASAQQVEDNKATSTGDLLYDLAIWFTGIFILTAALFMTAGMGIYQEGIYKQYGKHPKESLFFNHALPLPGFLLLATDIYSHIQKFNNSVPLDLAFGISLPRLWFFLIFNVITQYICIRSVFILTTECSSLTVTLVVTLRKFVSLIFSIWYFQNPFTPTHWCGTLLVFIGILIFTEVLPLDNLLPQKKTKKED